MRRAFLCGIAAVWLVGCAGLGPVSVAPRPPDASFGTALPAGTTAWSNASLARIFARLMHETEWGARRRRLLRMPEPVRVSLSGPGAAQYAPFLARSLAYVAEGAGIDIAPGAAETASIRVEMVPGRRFRRLLPSAACVLVPGRLDWEVYARNPDRLGGEAIVTARDWDTVTVFIPDSGKPWQVRSCLLEEIPQALGPLNDLDALADSIFNDDFAHLWPTRLDLLMLRVLYDPETVPGTDAATTEARARAVLDRLNPEGRSAPPLVLPDGARVAGWKTQVLDLLATGSERRAEAALVTAERFLNGTAFHCHTLFLMGRLLAERSPERALAVLGRAAETCTRLHGPDDIRMARIRLERAVAFLETGNAAAAAADTEGLAEVFAAHGQEERVAAALRLRARAMDDLRDREGSARAEAGARAWRRYSLGGD